jgi:hypothetical protein
LECVDLHFDEEGDPITTTILSEEIFGAQTQKPPRSWRLPKAAQIALRALAEAISESGEPAPASNRIPAGVRITTLDRWRNHAYPRGISTSEKPRARQAAFQRGSEHLISTQAVGMWGELVWLAA